MGEIHPHLIRYWLHSSEKTDSPETFAEKVNEICTVYHEAETVHENGGHTISVDEMTGIQALEHKYPDKPVIPGKAAHMEFEYIRHGTVSLIGFFDVATGRMEKPYLNSTRTEKDFVEAIRALIETDSEAPWTFVCDGLNIHKSESLVRFVAGQCGLSEDLGSKGRSGILKNQESRAEFLHHSLIILISSSAYYFLSSISLTYKILRTTQRISSILLLSSCSVCIGIRVGD